MPIRKLYTVNIFVLFCFLERLIFINVIQPNFGECVCYFIFILGGGGGEGVFVCLFVFCFLVVKSSEFV